MNTMAEIVPVADRVSRLQTLVEDVPFLAVLPPATRGRLLEDARIEDARDIHRTLMATYAMAERRGRPGSDGSADGEMAFSAAT